MRYSEWKRQVSLYNMTVRKAREELARVTEDRDNFFRESVGIALDQPATIEGTIEGSIEMMTIVMGMQNEEDAAERESHS